MNNNRQPITKAVQWGISEDVLLHAAGNGIQVEKQGDGSFSLYDEMTQARREHISAEQLAETIEAMIQR